MNITDRYFNYAERGLKTFGKLSEGLVLFILGFGILALLIILFPFAIIGYIKGYFSCTTDQPK